MRELKFKSGAVIYREGDPSDYVYIIREGQVEVTRKTDDLPTVLATLGGGQIFGEMGVIRGHQRSTTTCAVGAVTLVAISREKFLGAFDMENPIVLPILRMLCERLSNAGPQMVDGNQVDGNQVDVNQPSGVTPDAVKRIRILPASHQVETQIGADGVLIKKIPFRVGRRVEEGEPALKTPSHLALVAQDPHHLSPEHFVVEAENGYVVVRDMGSYLGTLVNGERIASFEHSVVAGLRFGENRIVTGGTESPYEFMLVIEKKD